MTNTISPCNMCSPHWPDPWEMLTVWLRKFSCIDFLCFLSLMQLLSSFTQCNSSWDGQTWVLLMQQLISWLPSSAKFVLDEWLAQGAMIQISRHIGHLAGLITLEMLSEDRPLSTLGWPVTAQHRALLPVLPPSATKLALVIPVFQAVCLGPMRKGCRDWVGLRFTLPLE